MILLILFSILLIGGLYITITLVTNKDFTTEVYLLAKCDYLSFCEDLNEATRYRAIIRYYRIKFSLIESNNIQPSFI